jgi:hypothetical protein
MNSFVMFCLLQLRKGASGSTALSLVFASGVCERANDV